MTFTSDILAKLQKNQDRVSQSIQNMEINSEGYIISADGKLAEGAGNLLRNLVHQPNILKSKIEKINKDRCLVLIKEKALENNNTTLHCAASIPESLEILLGIYPPDERLEAIGIQNKRHRTVLHEAISNSKSVSIILGLYSNDNQKLIAIQQKDEDDNTALHIAAAHPRTFQLLWALYPPDQRLSALEQKNKKGETVLHLAVNSFNTTPEFLHMLLQAHPEKTRLSAIQTQTKDGVSVLAMALDKPELLKVIVNSLSKEQLLLALEESKMGDNFLHSHSKSPHLHILLEKFSFPEQLALVLSKNSKGLNLLDKLGTNLQAMQSLLKTFPSASTWIKEDDFGDLELLPLFKTQNPAKKIGEMLSLYCNINKLAECENKTAKMLAKDLTLQLEEFIANKGIDEDKVSQASQKFCSEMKQGYQNLRTQGEFYSALLLNIALAATVVGFPIVIGKLLLTGCGFFVQTNAQKVNCSIEAAFNEVTSEDSSTPPIPVK